MTIAKPFLKWPGGKRKIAPKILELLAVGKHDRFAELFAGGGAVFFALRNQGHTGPALIADVNAELIRTYRAVRDEVEDVIAILEDFQDLHSERFYYIKRADEPTDNADIAARMIYLNKAGFNGLYRVNKKGGFNVPYGKNPNANVCDADNLRACSAALQGTMILTQSFEVEMSDPKPGTRIYCDPPYVPASATSNFTSYTADGFDYTDQRRLRDFAAKSKRKGAKVVLSNSDTAPVRELYLNDATCFQALRIQVRRSINADAATRGKVGELLIF